MAGYHIHSLDWKKFQKFAEDPTKAQLAAFADALADALEPYDDQFEDGDPMQDWPVDPKDLVEIARERLALPDWYGDLSDQGKSIVENAVVTFVHKREKELGHKYELNDSIYWTAIDAAQSHFRIKPDVYTEQVVSQFGHRPFRYHPQVGDRPSFEGYHPSHSMHAPEEVQQLVEEFNAAEPRIQQDPDALRDFEELMPALERIAAQGRMLYVEVDT